MNGIKTGLTLAGVAAALALGACSKKQGVADALPPQPATVADNGGGSGSGLGNTIVPGSNADFLAQMNGRNVIYFDTDKFDVDATDAAALRSQVLQAATAHASAQHVPQLLPGHLPLDQHAVSILAVAGPFCQDLFPHLQPPWLLAGLPTACGEGRRDG